MSDYSVELSEADWNHIIWHMYEGGLVCEVRDKLLNQLAEKGMEVIEK